MWQEIDAQVHFCHCWPRAYSANIENNKPVATGAGIRNKGSRSCAMSGLIFFVVFFGLIALASALGWTADSREYGEWSPSTQGARMPRV
jgi:hypothetical protein